MEKFRVYDLTVFAIYRFKYTDSYKYCQPKYMNRV